MSHHKSIVGGKRGARKINVSVNDIKRSEALVNAYFALLQADRWLFVAREPLIEKSAPIELRSLDEVRQSLSKFLEHLQTRVYEALEREDLVRVDNE